MAHCSLTKPSVATLCAWLAAENRIGSNDSLLIVNREDNKGWWGERLPRQSCATEADDMMEPSHSSL